MNVYFMWICMNVYFTWITSPTLSLELELAHAACDQEAYTFSEFLAYAENKSKEPEEAMAFAKRLWQESDDVLQDQPTTSWSDVLGFMEDSLVAMISARRFVVPKMTGCVVTFGAPGKDDSVDGLRSSDKDTWVVPWIAKTVGAVATGAQFSGKTKILLTYFRAEIGTGSQSEYAKRMDVKARLEKEIGEPVDIEFTIVDPHDVCSFYGVDFVQDA